MINFPKIDKKFKHKLKYVLLDINSLTIVPNINKEIYLSKDGINITPFIETIKLYFNLINYLGFNNIRYIIVFDTGISKKIIKIYPKYKSHRLTRRISKNIKFSNNIYNYNIALTDKFFTLMNEIVISGLYKSEADFIIGYLIKNLNETNKIIFTHDMDLLLANNIKTHIIYKEIKKNLVGYKLISNIDDICDLVNFQYLKNVKEYLYYKALLGDKSDNISRPYGITRKTLINNLFKSNLNTDITYKYIISYFNNKFNNDSIFKKFKYDFDRNLFIMNIFNDDIFTDDDLIHLNIILDKIDVLGNKKFIFDDVVDFFSEYQLYYDKDSLTKIYKKLNIIN